MNTGGAAFPSRDSVSRLPNNEGMTLRDYFAAAAMNADLISSGALDGPANALAEAAIANNRTVEDQIAFNAYALADAMLKARGM